MEIKSRGCQLSFFDNRGIVSVNSVTYTLSVVSVLKSFFEFAEALFERANGEVGLLFVDQQRR